MDLGVAPDLNPNPDLDIEPDPEPKFIHLAPSYSFNALVTYNYDIKMLSPPVIRGETTLRTIYVIKNLSLVAIRRSQLLTLLVRVDDFPTMCILKLYSLPLYLRARTPWDDPELVTVNRELQAKFHESAPAVQEAFIELSTMLTSRYQNELEIYTRLEERHTRGEIMANFPFLKATVEIPVSIPCYLGDHQYDCRGLLLQYVRGPFWEEFYKIQKLPNQVLGHLMGMIMVVARTLFGPNTQLAHCRLTLNHCKIRRKTLASGWRLISPYFLDYSQSLVVGIPPDDAARTAKTRIGDLRTLQDCIEDYLRMMGKEHLLPLHEPEYSQQVRNLSTDEAEVRVLGCAIGYRMRPHCEPELNEVVIRVMESVDEPEDIADLIRPVACPVVRPGSVAFEPDVGLVYKDVDTLGDEFLQRGTQQDYLNAVREIFIEYVDVSLESPEDEEEKEVNEDADLEPNPLNILIDNTNQLVPGQSRPRPLVSLTEPTPALTSPSPVRTPPRKEKDLLYVQSRFLKRKRFEESRAPSVAPDEEDGRAVKRARMESPNRETSMAGEASKTPAYQDLPFLSMDDRITNASKELLKSLQSTPKIQTTDYVTSDAEMLFGSGSQQDTGPEVENELFGEPLHFPPPFTFPTFPEADDLGTAEDQQDVSPASETATVLLEDFAQSPPTEPKADPDSSEDATKDTSDTQQDPPTETTSEPSVEPRQETVPSSTSTFDLPVRRSTRTRNPPSRYGEEQSDEPQGTGKGRGRGRGRGKGKG